VTESHIGLKGGQAADREIRIPLVCRYLNLPPALGASAVLLIDYVNNNPFHFSRILLFEDDLLGIDHGFSSFNICLISAKISALLSTAQSSSAVPAAHPHPPFPLASADSLVEQV